MLEVNSIVTYRGSSRVLRDISLRVAPREVVCLVGRNGAGKTTTAETIVGLLRAHSGSIILHGDDITRLPPHKRARHGLGYSPADCGIFSKLSVSENLMMSQWQAKKYAGDARRSAYLDNRRAAFEIFPELHDLQSRPGLHLSGGQRKMVAVARAMMLAPALLLLDEAFEGLSPLVVSRFAEAVIKIKALGTSILMAESQFGPATRIADRLYAIDRGEVVFEGTSKEAYSNERVLRILRG